MLAARLGVAFVDLDERTLGRLDCRSVAEAWSKRGESAFRTAEVEALKGAIGQTQTGGGVIALGGGTPTALGGEDLIRASGAISIYLRGEPALLRDRLTPGVGENRPSLTGADPLDEIEQVFHERDARYTEIADHVVELLAHEQPDETLSRLVGVIE